jgi:hypothetical protein
VSQRVALKQGARSTGADGVLHLLSQLGDELGAATPVERPRRDQQWPPIAMRCREDEELLLGLRQGLARLASSRRQGPTDGELSLCAVLDGAQLLARTEILDGQTEDLRRLLPAFAYLVMLPIVGEVEADRVAGRAAKLVAGAS